MTKKKRNTKKKRRASRNHRRSVRRGSDVANGKMSEVLIDIARPWIELLGPSPPLPAMKFAYQTCVLIWNVSRNINTEEREDEFKKAALEVVALTPKGTEAEMHQLIKEVYRRALALYPDDPRIIVDIEVEDLGDGDFHVMVISAQGQ